MIFSSSSSSLPFCPSSPRSLPLSPGSLDAEQTQCSLCKITRLIKANKQTTALRQLQMKANLYTINKRRSAFNLPVRPAHCSPPPFLSSSSSSSHSSHPPACSLSQSLLLCCWAGLKGREKRTDASIIHRSPRLSPSLCQFSPGFLRSARRVYLGPESKCLEGRESLVDGGRCSSGLSVEV